MSIGLSLIKAALREDATSVLRQLSPSLFTDEAELEAFNFLIRYHREYGRLPDVQVLSENGIVLPGRGTGTVDYYVDRLHSRAQFVEASPLVADITAAMESKDMAAVAANAARLSSALRDRDRSSPVVTIGHDAQDLVHDQRSGSRYQVGITTGYPTLDRLTGGYMPTDFVTLAGRTNTGKSYVLLKSAKAAWQAMNEVLIITNEMGVRQLTTRMVGMESGINTRYIRERRLSSLKQDLLAETVLGFQLLPTMHFVTGQKLADVGAVEGLINELQPKIVYIDAAYLMKVAQRGRMGRWEILEEVMETLQAIVLRTQVPMMITVQLGRAQGSRNSDLASAIDRLRGSDAISQLSSVVVTMAQGDGIARQNRRKYFLSKNREGEKEVEWWSRFEFNPMNFEECPNPAQRQRNNTIDAMARSET